MKTRHAARHPFYPCEGVTGKPHLQKTSTCFGKYCCLVFACQSWHLICSMSQSANQKWPRTHIRTHFWLLKTRLSNMYMSTVNQEIFVGTQASRNSKDKYNFSQLWCWPSIWKLPWKNSRHMYNKVMFNREQGKGTNMYTYLQVDCFDSSQNCCTMSFFLPS